MTTTVPGAASAEPTPQAATASAPEDWRPDALAGFECLPLPLSTHPLQGEDVLVATLVRRTLDADPQRDSRPRAVLYVPGWNDYFFHVHVAEVLEARGLTVYAVDPRRSGRSLGDPDFRDYVTDLADYHEELDAAQAYVAQRHRDVVVMAHSTGGLIASLWASQRPGRIAALVLNSPWIAMWGPPGYDAALLPGIRLLAARDPLMRLPLPDPADRYARSVHAAYGGDFDYDMTMKVAGAVPVRTGWLAAILTGHRRVAHGLDIDCPVFVACSNHSLRPGKGWSEEFRTADIVLSADNIARRAHKLGRLVTIARIQDGFHDLALSGRESREAYVAEMCRWLDSYVPADDSSREG